jgi:hypothetical protein
MAVEYLQGELQRVTRTIDLQESLVNGCFGEFSGCKKAGNAAIWPMLMARSISPAEKA